jgi:hypothetical protein
MITDAILLPFTTIFNAVFSVLPTWSLLGALGVSTSALGTLGESMGLVEPFFPVSESLTMVIVAYSVLLGIFAMYKLANWVYRHLPEILGCGPGGGG